MSMEVIQLDEDSDDEIDEIESPKNIIRIESDDDSHISHKNEGTLEIYVESDNNEEEVVCLEDTSSERSVTEDEDDDNDSEELHGSRPVSINKSSEAYKANQDLPSSIEKTDDDNAVDFDLFDFQEQPDICSPDNLNEDLNTFDDFKSETVDELREIITSDEDTKFGDILSQQLLSSPHDILQDLDFKIYGDQLFLSLESLKILFHSKEDNFLNDLMGSIERKGLRVGDCLKFTGWDLKHLSLAAVQLIQKNLIPVSKAKVFKLFLHQIPPTNCYVDLSRKIPVDQREDDETEPAQVDAEDELEAIEVSQNREMKRKGIRLPRGWKVLGKKTETELERQGQQHRVIKIDWKFKSPDGTVYDDLKTALSVAKKNRSKFEKWEIMANKPVKILEAAPAYVTLKQQLDDELDEALERDVFSLSGIRPVRKFPDNAVVVSKSKPLTKARAVAPIRMSAQLKSNPISLAQREKMERKSGPLIERFKLSEVSQVQSNLESDGWFSSKLMTMKLVSGGLSNGGLTLASKQNPKFCLSKTTSVTSKKVQVKVHQETKENLMIDLDHLAQSPVPVVLPSPGLLPLTPQKMPDFQRRLLRRHDLPSNWMIKRGRDPVQYISPAGEVFGNIEAVIERTSQQRKNNNNTPKKRKDSNLPQNSSVIRKLPSLSPPKKAKLADNDIVDLLLDTDSES